VAEPANQALQRTRHTAAAPLSFRVRWPTGIYPVPIRKFRRNEQVGEGDGQDY